MPQFNFSSFNISNILNTLLNDIPVSVFSYNFLIVGNTLIIPLGDYPKEVKTSIVDKKDVATSENSLTAIQTQDGSTVISQRVGDQIKISTTVSLGFFRKLFDFSNGNLKVQISSVGVVDALFDFAYQNFETTDCILINQTGIKGIGNQTLRIKDWNRSFDPNDPDKLVLDISLYFEPRTEVNTPQIIQTDQESINAILGI